MKSSNFPRASLALSLGLLSAGLSACHAPDGAAAAKAAPLRAMERRVDLAKFMGDWYVIAHIPTFIEKQAFNAVESYQLDPDGSVATTFKFNQGSFDGPLKTYKPRGFIHNRETNAEWRMRFVWPFKAPFLILALSDDYQTTVIGVPDRSYVWIMARTPKISPARYAELVEIVKNTGHDLSRLRRVPQR